MPHNTHQSRFHVNRREALYGIAGGAGSLLSVPQRGVLAGHQDPQPGRHHSGSAKHVIMIYMSGGYSHVDTFDPKPLLARKHDVSIGPRQEGERERFLKAASWKFRSNKQCGTEVSDLFPHLREVMHEAALIRSMQCDHKDHGEATLQLHTGSTAVAMPSLGSWLSYALGTENDQLPGHIVVSEHDPYNGPQVWDSRFLPTVHAGVRIHPGNELLPNLSPHLPEQLQQQELALLRQLNEQHLLSRANDPRLKGRMQTFKTAQGLQDVAPEVLDYTQETKSTLKRYGADTENRSSYAAQCIMARRLVEAGVRFVEIIDGAGACRDNWDAAHRDIRTHEKYAKRVDQPVAALIQDLKQRGLLDEVLIVFCTEFGRTPWAQDGKGTKSRNHHPEAFSCWLAGGGVKPGVVYGRTDDIGNLVEEDAVHVHDFHATILHLLGIDHEQLTYRHAGRDFRLTDVYGRVIQEIIS